MRLIDADAYAAEMAKWQDACGKWMDSAIDELTIQRAEGAYTMLCEAKLTLDKMPTIDAVPVVHGEWINESLGCNWYGKCSVCGEEYNVDSWYGSFKYCPNCGAMMGERREG